MQSQMSAGYELSPQQRQIFWRQREYTTVGLAILLEGNANVASLREGIQALVDRHEILRTSFQRRAGMKFPFQVVQERAELPWNEIDLSALPDSRQRSRIEELLGDASKINIESGPVVWAGLVKLDAGRHVLALTFSSLCVDRSSLNNLFSEIQTHLAGTTLAHDILQYADYSEWQKEWLRKDDEEAKPAVEFWKALAFQSIPGLNLPLESKSLAGSASGETVPVPLDTTTLRGLGGYELENFLFACWQAFLWRMTGRQEFVIGYVSDGRNHEEFAEGVGVFRKTLPIRVAVEEKSTFVELLRESGEQLASARERQDYFAADLIHDHIPVGFAFETLSEKAAAGDVMISEFGRAPVASDSRLQLRCSRVGGSLVLALDFDPSRIAGNIARQFAEAFSILCGAAASSHSSPVGALPIISEAMRRKVIIEFNQTAADYPKDKCLHQLFEEQAARHPNRPALCFGESELSYFELNRRANQIAHILRQSGVGPNVPVALCLERSAEMIVALLGVLKAGGCYVPLIPDNPKARLAHQLSETGAPVVLTQQKHVDRVPQFQGKVFCLDHDGDLLASAPDGNPGVEMSPENMVYVIYTSGSTGAPKGVAVRHSNLVNYSCFICQRLELEKYPEGLHFATVSTIGADLGNTCIFPALISGGCLHVIGYELAMSPALFREYASRHPIDVLKITPSHLSTLLDSDAALSVLPRKYLVLGGEAARWSLIEQVRKSGKCAIFNHYGPTEATVGCCTFSVDRAQEVNPWEPATVPIGRPIANDQVYILDRRMQPVPVGVAGELSIGGAGIAPGYLKQPEQTRECFVPNPFSDDPAARLYRTGDLARFLPDGNIEFLGRIDQQVKIRGFRVEPAEIESVLKRYDRVKQAAIVPFDDKSGAKRLAAYVVAADTRAEEVRAFLSQELPDYMVPAAIVRVDSLPLTPNGKLDLRALPSPEQQAPVRDMVAPRTADEEKLAGIWQNVLKLERVGVSDNFFELGGHSLLATQIIARIRNTFHVQMPLHTLLQNPTISALAEEIGHCPAIESEQQEMARLLQELEGISEEEAERLLAAELQKDKSGPDY